MSIPRQLGLPWHQACTGLGLPHILVAAGVDMWNFEKRSLSGGFTINNLKTVTSMTGTVAESNFHVIPCAMHAAAGPIVPKIFLCHHLIWESRNAELALILRELAETLGKMREIFSHVRRILDKHDFYDLYRPLLGGFYPQGLTLTGVETVEGITVKTREPAGLPCWGGQSGVEIKAKGPSAGQSTMVLLFDTLLGVSHGGSAREFQEVKLYYTPNKFNYESNDKNCHITSGYVDGKIYEENPLTLRDFYKYLDQNGHNLQNC